MAALVTEHGGQPYRWAVATGNVASTSGIGRSRQFEVERAREARPHRVRHLVWPGVHPELSQRDGGSLEAIPLVRPRVLVGVVQQVNLVEGKALDEDRAVLEND